MGNFNLPELNWDWASAPNKSIYRIFLEFFNDPGLHQFVNSPTRNNNILDLILSNDPLLISTIEITCPLASSDHNIITFRLNGTTPDTSVSSHGYYDFNRADYISLNNFLSGINWNQAFRDVFQLRSVGQISSYVWKRASNCMFPLSSRVSQRLEDSHMKQYHRKKTLQNQTQILSGNLILIFRENPNILSFQKNAAINSLFIVPRSNSTLWQNKE